MGVKREEAECLFWLSRPEHIDFYLQSLHEQNGGCELREQMERDLLAAKKREILNQESWSTEKMEQIRDEAMWGFRLKRADSLISEWLNNYDEEDENSLRQDERRMEKVTTQVDNIQRKLMIRYGELETKLRANSFLGGWQKEMIVDTIRDSREDIWRRHTQLRRSEDRIKLRRIKLVEKKYHDQLVAEGRLLNENQKLRFQAEWLRVQLRLSAKQYDKRGEAERRQKFEEKWTRNMIEERKENKERHSKKRRIGGGEQSTKVGGFDRLVDNPWQDLDMGLGDDDSEKDIGLPTYEEARQHDAISSSVHMKGMLEKMKCIFKK